ncbi:UNVERIFIED_CONTAM: hypothetical protein Sradi_6085500 [Sesamum radiatum]|uniref:Uncharacterized protein n=1 Tax=Sesamum radiatum TaxID=300843 RepID=A0AAW2KKL0_SESRA
MGAMVMAAAPHRRAMASHEQEGDGDVTLFLYLDAIAPICEGGGWGGNGGARRRLA